MAYSERELFARILQHFQVMALEHCTQGLETIVFIGQHLYMIIHRLKGALESYVRIRSRAKTRKNRR